MTRAAIDYARRSEPSRTYAGIDPETPVAGFYRYRLRSGGVAVAVEIFFDAPVNPDFGANDDEPMHLDRSPRWQARVNGDYSEIGDLWPFCAAEPIDRAEADHLIGLQRWGADHGHAAIADPRRALSPLESPLMF